jgi:hypothetical protein
MGKLSNARTLHMAANNLEPQVPQFLKTVTLMNMAYNIRLAWKKTVLWQKSLVKMHHCNITEHEEILDFAEDVAEASSTLTI